MEDEPAMAQVEVPGLRVRHREGRRQRILLSASELFRSLGYDDTTVDAIAAQAEVSVPTIYSFFSSKHDLLLGLFEEDRRRVQAMLAPVLDALPTDPSEALFTIAQTFVERGFVEISHKPIWREISSAALKASPDRRASILRFQDIQVDALRTFLENLHRKGVVRSDIDLESAARSLYAVSRNCFRLYLMTERATPAILRAMLKKDLSTVFRGLLAERPAQRQQAKRKPK
jgi:AcrR family transcriptional regulator